MNRRQADIVVGVLVAAVLLLGGALSWQAYQQQRALDQMGSMMGTSMGAVHGTNPAWYVLGTLLVSVVIGGVYLTVRDGLNVAEESDRPRHEQADDGSPTGTDPPTDEPQPNDEVGAGERPRARVLDLLPDDERRVLEPVLTSPGLTQIELRDRSDFSKSKVSQTVSALEKRGLLYRERQGRTYRVYPSDELQQ
ncbi:helix-turn-helix transcriptional regulator [Halobacteriaceae archaeon GCM10025711]